MPDASVPVGPGRAIDLPPRHTFSWRPVHGFAAGSCAPRSANDSRAQSGRTKKTSRGKTGSDVPSGAASRRRNEGGDQCNRLNRKSRGHASPKNRSTQHAREDIRSLSTECAESASVTRTRPVWIGRQQTQKRRAERGCRRFRPTGRTTRSRSTKNDSRQSTDVSQIVPRRSRAGSLDSAPRCVPRNTKPMW